MCFVLDFKASRQDLVTKRSSKNVYIVFDFEANHPDLLTKRSSKHMYFVLDFEASHQDLVACRLQQLLCLGFGGSFVSIEQSALGIEAWCSFGK